MRELTRYWRDEFDWRRQEELINRFHHVRGSGIHFIHERSSRPPLLLLHGWPGSFVEMLGIIPLLREKFDVIVPTRIVAHEHPDDRVATVISGVGPSDTTFIESTGN